MFIGTNTCYPTSNTLFLFLLILSNETNTQEFKFFIHPVIEKSLRQVEIFCNIVVNNTKAYRFIFVFFFFLIRSLFSLK